MANVYNYGLAGVGSDVQYGKNGPHLSVINTTELKVSTDGSTLSQLSVATTPTDNNHATSKFYVDSLISGGVNYRGTVDASLSPAANGITAPLNGDLYRVTTAGTVFKSGVSASIGDFFVYNGTTWDYIDAVDATTVGTTNRIAVTSSGPNNFTIDIDAAYVGQSSITTLGTVTTGTWNGTFIGRGFGGTGTDTSAFGVGTFNVNAGGGLVVATPTPGALTDGQTLRWNDTSGAYEFFSPATAFTSGDGIDYTSNVVSVKLTSGSALAFTGTTPNGTLGIKGGTSGQALLSTGASTEAAFGQLNIAGGTNVTGTLAVTNGGTGFASYAVGDLLYADTTTSLAKKSIGTAGQVLTVNGTADGYVFSTPVTNAFSSISDGTTTATSTGPSTINLVDATNGGIKVVVVQTSASVATASLSLAVSDLSAAAGNMVTADFVAGYDTANTTNVKFSLAQVAQGVSTSLNLAGTYQPLDATLTSLAAYNTNGILVQTAADTFTGRTITADATAGKEGTTITDGDGVAGNPTVGTTVTGLTAGSAVAGTDVFFANQGASNVKVTAAQLATYVAGTADTLVRRATIGFAATANVGAVLPTNAYITRVVLVVTSAYNVGAAFTLTAGGTLATDSDVNLQVAGTYVVDLYGASNEGTNQIVAAIASGTSGAANVIVEYKTA